MNIRTGSLAWSRPTRSLPTGDHNPGEAFLAWRKFSQEVPVFPAAQIVNGGSVSTLSPEVIAAYDAPFPGDEYMAGARQFPRSRADHARRPGCGGEPRRVGGLEQFERPFLCAFSDSDPITAGGDGPLRKLIPGAREQAHVTIAGGGHFLQEDKGRELAEVVVKFVTATRQT